MALPRLYLYGSPHQREVPVLGYWAAVPPASYMHPNINNAVCVDAQELALQLHGDLDEINKWRKKDKG